MFEDLFLQALKEQSSEFCIEWDLVNIKFFNNSPFFKHSSSFAFPSPFHLLGGNIMVINILKPDNGNLDENTILNYDFTYSMLYELIYENGRDIRSVVPTEGNINEIGSIIGDVFNKWQGALNQTF